MRLMLQSEAAECGLTCVAMIAAYHGHQVNVGGLRRRFPSSMKGATIAELITVASNLELSPRALRLELNELTKLQLPAILHWDLNHFVVLDKIIGRNLVILDPASGRKSMSIAKVGKHFTGVALELVPSADFKPVDARVITKLSDLWTRLRNFRGADQDIN